MDEFAQTRQPDDLFDDDFTPIDEPTQTPIQPPRAPRSKAPQRQYPQRQPAPDSAPDDSANPPLLPEQATKPTPAVRGDRSATGGINKPKLTEDELSEKLAAAKLNNAKREEAHRIAEADEASFQEREAQASQKRREEGAARRAMDQEREKNRLRKLAVKGRREWDEGKEENDLSKERGGQFRRGAHGGVAYRGGRGGYRDFENEEASARDYGQNRGRGRGGDRERGARGRGGRGGRARDGLGKGSNIPPNVQHSEDFPSLPSSQSPAEPLVSPTGEKQSWADQVENVQATQNA
ncbi:MAG: hypothetical protein Q9195_000137 [Heterodermia aff. obscurata]